MKKQFSLSIFVFLSLILVRVSSYSAVVVLPVLSTAQTDPIFKNFAADLMYRPVEGASSLSGKNLGLGFEFGVTAIGTSTSSIASIIGKSTWIPGANLDLAVGLPYGLGIELGFVPSVSISGTKFSNFGGDIRWNFSRLLPRVPVDLTLRGMVSSSELSTDQPLNGATINVKYKSTQTGAHLTVGKSLGPIEPYVGVGLIKLASTLSYAGTQSLFGSSFATGTTSVSGNSTSSWFTGGLQLRLLIISLGAQYDRVYGVDTFSTKFAFRF